MKTNELKTPLIKSIAIISVAIIFMCFVIYSGDQTFLGSLWAIISGIFYTALYLVGLTIAVTFSIACLIGIFLGAVYLFSKEQATEMYAGITNRIQKIPTESCITKCFSNGINLATKTKLKKDDSIEKKLEKLQNEITELKEKEKKTAERLNKIIQEKE
ncbi:MAG: hypothetical protein OCC45_09700 [Desulfotalea sp.]